MAKAEMSDCEYNVHKQLVKRLQFLWHVEHYAEDAAESGHSVCAEMWKEIEKNERKNVALLKGAVARDSKH